MKTRIRDECKGGMDSAFSDGVVDQVRFDSRAVLPSDAMVYCGLALSQKASVVNLAQWPGTAAVSARICVRCWV